MSSVSYSFLKHIKTVLCCGRIPYCMYVNKERVRENLEWCLVSMLHVLHAAPSQSDSQSVSESVNLLTHALTHSLTQPTNQSIDRSLDRSINQSTDHSSEGAETRGTGSPLTERRSAPTAFLHSLPMSALSCNSSTGIIHPSSRVEQRTNDQKIMHILWKRE